MGEHSIIVEPAKLKFVNEAVKTTTSAPSGSTMTSRDASNTTTTTSTATTTSNRPYPDHAVLSATKDQLKTLPKFKY